MSLHIIVDGYNLIRQSNTLSVIENESLEAGRDALIDSLIAYKRLRHHAVTVVFDGTEADAILQEPRTRRGGIQILFSHKGQQADTVIKRMASQERERAVIVSSDKDIADYAEQQGAAAIGATAFEEKMKAAILMPTGTMPIDPEEPTEWKPTTKKKGPSRRRSKRERRRKVRTRKL